MDGTGGDARVNFLLGLARAKPQLEEEGMGCEVRAFPHPAVPLGAVPCQLCPHTGACSQDPGTLCLHLPSGHPAVPALLLQAPGS